MYIYIYIYIISISCTSCGELQPVIVWTTSPRILRISLFFINSLILFFSLKPPTKDTTAQTKSNPSKRHRQELRSPFMDEKINFSRKPNCCPLY